jgi:hypothetical protein
MRVLFSSAVSIALSFAALSAQTVEGRLLDSGSDQPIILGQVLLLTGGGEVVARTFTDETGFFSLTAPDGGSFFLRGERFGYRAQVDGVFDLGEGGVISVEFRLPRNPVVLDTLQVSAEPRSTKLTLLGFYDRRDIGMGKFIGPKEIAEKPVFGTTDLLRNIPRVQIRQRPFGGSEVVIRGAGAVSLTGGGVCYPKVVVDGNVILRGEPARLDQVIQPSEIEAIEVYRGPSETPLQFGGISSPCGVILIWTR